ncbi:invasion associated locus B family protein [Inquilinus limosus]
MLRTRRRKSFLGVMAGLVLAAGVALPGAASAQNVQYISSSRDWHAFQFTENGSKACYIASKPTKAEPANVRHGDVFILVTNRPAEKQKNVVSLQVGYTLKQGADVTATVGGKNFQLFTDGNTAWSRDAAADDALVGAMKAGSTMTVKATSSRGTGTSYTFSLAGISAALNEINKACGA